MSTSTSRLHVALAALATVAAAALPCTAIAAGPAPRTLKPIPAAIEPGSLTPVTLGELIFNDPSLSASGTQACASCHDKQRGHADPLGTFMPLGGPAMNRQGHRSSMSLAYQGQNPPFAFVGPLSLPRGGYFWDGRANTLVDQAAGPLFNPSEMANPSLASFMAKLQAAPYWAEMQRLYPTATRSSARNHFLLATQQAVAAYQQGDTDFALFNSKFDRVMSGTAAFTAAEGRGFGVFNNPGRGNCASCHTLAFGPNGARPLFTDHSYHAHGLPRNMAIQANADPNYYDMGLCGPDRTDLALRVDLCGAFRTPTLRNVALTAPYFHNGIAATLTDAVSFYATRDTDPARWYPLVNNIPDKFNDLPLGFRGNVVRTAPFGTIPNTNLPRLSPQDVSDLVAFLNTLTDDPTAPRGSAFVQDVDAAAAALRNAVRAAAR